MQCFYFNIFSSFIFSYIRISFGTHFNNFNTDNLVPLEVKVGDKVLITKPKHTTSIVYQKEIHYAVVSKRESNITTLEGAGIISRAIFEKSTKGMGAIILFSFFIPIAFFWLMIHPEYSFRLGRLQQKLLYRIFHLK